MLLHWSSPGRVVRRDGSSRRQAQRAMLRVEQLEDRWVPDTYTWNGLDYGQASIPGNWTGGDPTRAPGPSDTVVFDGNVKNTICEMNIAEVQGVEIKAAYTSEVRIQPAPGNNTLEVTNTFKMAGGTIANAGANATLASLKLTEASLFTWSGGKADRVVITLGDSMNHEVTGTIEGDVELANGSSLYNEGLFTWVSGQIKVSNSLVSKIVNMPDGIFEVKSTGAFSNLTYPNQPAGYFLNYGTLKFNTSGVRIAADFLNVSNGIVRVYPGQVQFDYQAEQTGSGVFELRNGTVKVASNQVLGIRDGLLTGAGTIDGNLNLGYDGGPQTAVTIRPGIDNGIGTIHITQSWEMFSPSGQTWIKVDDGGNPSKITAGGWAKLWGVLWVENSSNYKPAHEKKIDFLTAGLGFFGTNFVHRDMTYWGSWADPVTKKALVWTFNDDTDGIYSIVTKIVPGS